MRKKRKHSRPEQIYARRVLGEANARENIKKGFGTNSYHCKLNLSDVLGSIPMTINQEDIQVEASFEKGKLSLLVYCDELLGSPDDLAGGIYAVEEEEEFNRN